MERVARENNARIEYVPILLGALFKAIGTPNVPMLAISPAKREYMSKDLQDWCAWHGVEFNFPSVFPIRTVLPLRVAIQVCEACAPPVPCRTCGATRVLRVPTSLPHSAHRAACPLLAPRRSPR